MPLLEWERLIGVGCRPDLSSSLAIAKPDWETYCSRVGDMIIQEQTPQRVMEVRTKLYELLSHCIPPTIILKVRSTLSPCLFPYDRSSRRSRIAWCKKWMKVSSLISCTGQLSMYGFFGRSGPLSSFCTIGKPHAPWQQKDISSGSLGCQSHVLVQGQFVPPFSARN